MSEYTPPDAFEYLSRLQDRIDKGENPIQDMMGELREALLSNDQTRRQLVDVPPDAEHKVYYRKMSRAEWNNATNKGKTNYDFAAPFKYTNTNNYRFWVSTSLDKVRVFGNEDVTTDTDVVVCFTFAVDLTKQFTLKSHQEKGVQSNADVVAIHREGFAPFYWNRKWVMNMTNDSDRDFVLGMDKAFNLGFTSKQASNLNKFLASSVLVTG